MDTFWLVFTGTKIALVMGALLSVVPLLVWVERRGAGLIQNRLGPNRVGPLGLFQPIADAIKLIWKEDRVFRHTKGLYYVLAPIAVVVPAFMVIAVIPFADTIWWEGRQLHFQLARLDIGFLYLFAISSLSVYGIILAGWSSQSKYAFFGALRSASQMISYEVALGLSVIGVFLVFGSLDPVTIVRAQGTAWFHIGSLSVPKWGVLVQPLGFLLFLPAMFAETNRLPFDLPEGESELIAGYHLEYGGLKFALFFMAEYLHIVVASCVIVTLYFGGWQLLPGLQWIQGVLGMHAIWWKVALQCFSLLVKVAFFVWFFVWVRWTLPRFRYDQVMVLGWKVLLPLAIFNVVLTAGLIVGGVF